MMHGDRKPNFTSMILIGAHLTRHGTCMVSQTPVPERDGPRAAVAEYRHSDECPARASARATTGLSSFCTLTRRVRSLLVPRSTSALVSKSSSCLPTPPHAFHIIILLRHTCQQSSLLAYLLHAQSTTTCSACRRIPSLSNSALPLFPPTSTLLPAPALSTPLTLLCPQSASPSSSSHSVRLQSWTQVPRTPTGKNACRRS